jgi:ABC-type transport system involved in cytochrome bd biosynthesis fused ATPase/permease subunit
MDDDMVGQMVVWLVVAAIVIWVVSALVTLLARYWPIPLTLIIGWALWHWYIAPSQARQAREASDRLRHHLARLEIDEIQRATLQAMSEVAALTNADIESTAIEESAQ